MQAQAQAQAGTWKLALSLCFSLPTRLTSRCRRRRHQPTSRTRYIGTSRPHATRALTAANPTASHGATAQKLGCIPSSISHCHPLLCRSKRWLALSPTNHCSPIVQQLRGDIPEPHPACCETTHAICRLHIIFRICLATDPSLAVPFFRHCPHPNMRVGTHLTQLGLWLANSARRQAACMEGKNDMRGTADCVKMLSNHNTCTVLVLPENTHVPRKATSNTADTVQSTHPVVALHSARSYSTP